MRPNVVGDPSGIRAATVVPVLRGRIVSAGFIAAALTLLIMAMVLAAGASAAAALFAGGAWLIVVGLVAPS